jgi:hypothetical protein
MVAAREQKQEKHPYITRREERERNPVQICCFSLIFTKLVHRGLKRGWIDFKHGEFVLHSEHFDLVV